MKKIILAVFALSTFQISIAQGCSDAGFCSVGSFASHQKNNDAVKNQSTIKLGSAFGIGEQSINVITPYFQFNQQFKDFQLQVKATYNSASKNSYSISTIGDLFLIASKSIANKNGSKTIFNAGLKLPLGNEDSKSNGQSLPLAFQSTLGTVDFITGITYQNKNWDFSTALQIPITKNNKNSFITPNNNSNLNQFVSTNQFSRKADVLIRATKNNKISNKINLSFGALTIYHLGNDTFIDGAGKTNTITQSEGLTLNLNLSFNWSISDKVSLNFTTALPAVVRKSRPDGLTRSFVFIPELTWKL